MKVTRTWEELKDLYAERGEVRRTESGFELIDKATGIIFDLPKEYRVFIDGGVIDPIQFLALPWHIWSALLGRMEPLVVECICGKVTWIGENNDQIKFYPADLEADVAQNDAVLVKVHWNMAQGSVDYGWDDWMRQHYGHDIIWSLCKTDNYRITGDWYWLLRAESGNMVTLGLYTVLMHYVRVLLGVYNLADEAAENFERNKMYLRIRMREYLDRLPGRVHWIVAVKERDLWPKYDANQELWERNEYDWQITERGDGFEIRRRGGSPGVILVEWARFDEVGSWKCSTLVNAMENQEDAD